MCRLNRFLAVGVAILVSGLTAGGDPTGKRGVPGTKSQNGILLWNAPDDISTRDLFYGPGGKKGQPQPPFAFVKEDLAGTNPKFVVQDASGHKWKVKLGVEAKPETAASRFVWAAGYYTSEEYYLPEIHVTDLPHLSRGQNFVLADGSVHGVRLKRVAEHMKKVGNWTWRDSPFSGTREMNGLRVLMTLINNWDLKDINNAIYERPDGTQIYEVSDLGTSFGSTGFGVTPASSKGNLAAYKKSRFIVRVKPESVDFGTPTAPIAFRIFTPEDYMDHARMGWIGRRIPKDDVKWIGGILARLSPSQIGDAFRAAGFTDREVDGFARVFGERIAELNRL
jgi:hypothetical protein